VRRALLFLATICRLAAQQEPAARQEEEFGVYTDSPRLLLNPQRLRLLRRERERQSIRWEQFHTLVTGRAALPEPGFAYALHYQVSGDAASGRQAIEWALGAAQDLRQLALVYDWTQPLLTPGQKKALAEKIIAGRAKSDGSLTGVRNRVFATLALADTEPDRGAPVLREVVRDWWRQGVARRMDTGTDPVPRGQLYALLETVHAIRDNLKIDLREDAVRYFAELPLYHIAGHYPAPLAAPENEYRIPAVAMDPRRPLPPDRNAAAMSRVAGLALVALDTNSIESQYLQGWLIQDRFLLRSGLGAPYEFLWANPYQPGLTFYRLPLTLYDPRTGRLFARSSWDDDAMWLGLFDGQVQLFEDGEVKPLAVGDKAVEIGTSKIVRSRLPLRMPLDREATVLLGLPADTAVLVEIDDEEMRELRTDRSGTLVLKLPKDTAAAARVRAR
jgi:hypothetical protein